MANRREKVEAIAYFLYLDSKITADGDCSREIRWCLLLGRKMMTNLDSVLIRRNITLLTKVHISQAYGLPSVYITLWELDCKEGRALKNWCLWTMVLEKTPESHLDSKDIKPVNLKGDEPWIFTGRTDAEAEAPVFWSSNVNSWHIRQISDVGKNWGQKEKNMTEDEIVGQHHWCNGHELGQSPGDGEGQGGLTCCSPWGRKQ